MSSTVAAAARTATRAVNTTPKKPPLTHFLSIPLGHIPVLRERVAAFTGALLAADPAIAGLDASVVIPPRRLHITLGVLSLVPDEEKITQASQGTVSAALHILHGLREQLREAVAPASSVTVPLVALDIMRSGEGRGMPHVLHVGPREDTLQGTPLQRVTHLVHDAFRAAGLMQDDRPLKLHCTLVNTLYRKPRTKKRVPFSYAQIKDSAALAAIRVIETAEGEKALRVDLGSWAADEIQLCEMGSHDPEGAYVRVGGVSLRAEEE